MIGIDLGNKNIKTSFFRNDKTNNILEYETGTKKLEYINLI